VRQVQVLGRSDGDQGGQAVIAKPGQEAPLWLHKAWLDQQLQDGKIETCMLCGGRVKIYKRHLSDLMAKTLIMMYKRAGRDFIHVPSLPNPTRETSKMAWWGLVEEEHRIRDDGGRAGYWRLTALGERFVLKRAKVLKYRYEFHGDPIGEEGPEIDIEDALREPFSYRNLMRDQ
jgi:hypothetical protein